MLRAIALVVLLAGCASTDPYSFHYVELADQSRILHAPPPGSATVVVRREPSFSGVALNHFLTVDGVKIAQLQQEEQHTFTVAPGRYVVGHLCEAVIGGPALGETVLQAEAGKTAIYRLYTVQQSGCLIEVMSR